MLTWDWKQELYGIGLWLSLYKIPLIVINRELHWHSTAEVCCRFIVDDDFDFWFKTLCLVGLCHKGITWWHQGLDRSLIRNYQGTTQITSVDQLGRNFVANVVRFAKWAYYLILHNVLGPWWSLVFPARYSSFLASDQRHCRGFRVPPGTVQLTHVVWWYHSHPTKIFPDGSFNEDDTFLVRTFYCPFEREGSTCSVCS